MSKGVIQALVIATVFLFLIMFTSAEIIIQEQPRDLYNIGETINLPLKVSASNNVNEFLTLKISCGSSENEIHKEFLSLKTGEEKQINSQVPLIPRFTGLESTNCKVTANIDDETTPTREFRVSNKIVVNITSDKTFITPGETITIKGQAKKENGNPSEGIVEIEIAQNNNQSIRLSDTVKNGEFELTLPIPSNAEAGKHALKTTVYEKINNQIANQGQAYINVEIEQIPTSLEIISEKEINPSEEIRVKAVLHDQTGQNIPSDVIISIKNNQNKILQQFNTQTNSEINYEIPYNEPPKEWTIVAVSHKLSTTYKIQILENEKIETKILNNTLILTNKGNVPFTKPITITVGDKDFSFETNIDVDKTKKYDLSAPEGDYQITASINGNSILNEEAYLTGKTIEVKEQSGVIKSFVTHPMIWIFIIAILGFITFMVFNKGIKRSFIGYIGRRKQKKAEAMVPLSKQKDTLLNTNSPAELTLSLKGDKQDASIINLKIKNIKDVKVNKKVVEEPLHKITKICEDQKASIYENNDNIFIILAPIKTKTFRNETTALKLAQLIQGILDHSNKLLKQKIEYGISLNQGTIVAKQEDDELKFMSMGTLMTTSKKIAALSRERILLSEDMKTKLSTSIKTQKHHHENLDFYSITDIKQHNPEHEKFISNFLHRLEGKK